MLMITVKLGNLSKGLTNDIDLGGDLHSLKQVLSLTWAWSAATNKHRVGVVAVLVGAAVAFEDAVCVCISFHFCY